MSQTSTLPELLAELQSDVFEWEHLAKCREEPTKLGIPSTMKSTDLFFSQSEDNIRKAKTICRSCPVQADCLKLALITREPYGIWGGSTPQDRKRIWRRIRETAGNGWNSKIYDKLIEETGYYLPVTNKDSLRRNTPQ